MGLENSVLFFLGVLLIVIILGAVGIWLTNRRIRELKESSRDTQSLSLLQQQIANLETQLTTRLSQMTGQVNERLRENAEVLRDTHKTIGERLDSTTSIVGAVRSSLGKLEEANRHLYEVGKDIASLQELLRAPTFRGEVGEFLLGNLLSQLLPSEHFTLKHEFKNGEVVDAVIRLGGNLVPIDSKFPLENFRKMVENKNEGDRKSNRRKFVADVKRRINEIAQKYILPDEGTFEFALMYIPAENVYYETIIKDESLAEERGISSYALARKVIPVSPNSLYAYLQAILLGLKGLKIEKNAQEIIANLGRLSTDLSRFKEDFQVMGKHLSNTRNKYEEAEKRLDRFTDKLIGAGNSSLPVLDEPDGNEER
ncbi:MAG: DNA recombination protein RmuC [Nitrospirae bacterium]|nr:DNA recombination protein RmuC [Nitrospirota bacterium]